MTVIWILRPPQAEYGRERRKFVLVLAGDRNPATDSLLAEARAPQVKPGGLLNVAYEFWRYRLCPRETQRIIFDGNAIRFDLGTQSRPLSGPVAAFH